MIGKADKFWISFILRLAFGLLFLIAAINQFSAGGARDFGPDAFARGLSAQFEEGWVGEFVPTIDNPLSRFIEWGKEESPAAAADAEKPAAGAPAPGAPASPAAAPADDEDAAPKDPVNLAYVFLFLLPFAFAGLSVAILTGIFLKPALRTGAILLVLLGLGKYITSGQDLSTTANDFFFAFLICMGLWFLGQEARRERELEQSSAA